jgi:coenzyme F420-reducing hydrogenase delta subunit
MNNNETFEPTIIGFTCNWCSYRAADLAGTARMKYPPNIRLIRLMCSGRLDPTFVFKALANGADGVMITGCHPGECHYLEQNYKALRRFHLMRRTLQGLGLEPAFDWFGPPPRREPSSRTRLHHSLKRSAPWVRFTGANRVNRSQ